jgi:beta-hydroxylase
MTTAFFSSIESGTYIRPHRGAYKGYLRYHFGVDIPANDNSCAIRIDDKLYNWSNGKSLIFDDTYIHDVWNNSGKDRVVLYVDFIRPLPKHLTTVSKLLTHLTQNKR